MTGMSGRNRQVLAGAARIVLYQLVNASSESKKRCLGYELGITRTESGKIERSWLYEASELRWARHGFQTAFKPLLMRNSVMCWSIVRPAKVMKALGMSESGARNKIFNSAVREPSKP